MTKHEQHNTNFWFGFAVGSVTLSVAAYFMGTKKGRSSLKKFLEYADNMEDIPEELVSLIPTLQNMLRHNPEETMTEEEPKSPLSTMESIIEKMRASTEKRKQVKKFFVKGGKVIDSSSK